MKSFVASTDNISVFCGRFMLIYSPTDIGTKVSDEIGSLFFDSLEHGFAFKLIH